MESVMQMYDGEGNPLPSGYVPQHGDNAWSKGMTEYKYSVRGEGWMLRRDFEGKYQGGGYPLE